MKKRLIYVKRSRNGMEWNNHASPADLLTLRPGEIHDICGLVALKGLIS